MEAFKNNELMFYPLTPFSRDFDHNDLVLITIYERLVYKLYSEMFAQLHINKHKHTKCIYKQFIITKLQLINKHRNYKDICLKVSYLYIYEAPDGVSEENESAARPSIVSPELSYLPIRDLFIAFY